MYVESRSRSDLPVVESASPQARRVRFVWRHVPCFVFRDSAVETIRSLLSLTVSFGKAPSFLLPTIAAVAFRTTWTQRSPSRSTPATPKTSSSTIHSGKKFASNSSVSNPVQINTVSGLSVDSKTQTMHRKSASKATSGARFTVTNEHRFAVEHAQSSNPRFS